MSHLKLECAEFPTASSQLEVPGAVITFPPLGLEGFNPLTPGRYANRVRISKRRSGEGGGEKGRGYPGAGLSAEKTSLSRSHTLSPRSVGPKAHRCPFLSLQPPSRGPGPTVTSLLSAASPGVSGTLCPALARIGLQALPIPPPTNPILSLSALKTPEV